MTNTKMPGEKVTSNNIPFIEFSGENLKPGTDSWLKTCKMVMQALEENGCFIIDCKNFNGFSLELHDSIFRATEELFDLPHETKIKNTNPKPSHGYIARVPGTPLIEGMNIDHAETLEDCRNFTSLMWPNGNEFFCKSAHAFSKVIAELEKVIMRMIFESYGVEKYYDDYMKATTLLLRFLKYKKPEGEANNPIAHTDKSFISFLHQNKIKGLEIQTKDGDWFTFEPNDTTFLVMAGDAAVAWSNGRTKACYHRVAVREDGPVRNSLGVFSYQKGMVETPKEFINEDHPQRFKSFNHVDFLCYYDKSDNRIKAESLIKNYCGI